MNASPAYVIAGASLAGGQGRRRCVRRGSTACSSWSATRPSGRTSGRQTRQPCHGCAVAQRSASGKSRSSSRTSRVPPPAAFVFAGSGLAAAKAAEALLTG